MTTPQGTVSQDAAKLPRRDWFLLPLLSLLTLGVLAGGILILGKTKFPASHTSHLQDCLVFQNSSTPVKGVPNSSCWDKAHETPLTQYRFDDCGYRTDSSCKRKQDGAFRIVLVGSSYALGMHVPREKSYAALLPGKLSALTGRKVEVYNEGMYAGTPHSVDLRFDDALAAKPDLILWTIAEWDIPNSSMLLPEVDGADAAAAGAKPDHSLRAIIKSAQKEASTLAAESWARSMLLHYLYQSQSQSLKSYTGAPDGDSGVLKASFSPLWTERLKTFAGYAAEIEAKANAAGVPLVVVLVPSRAQAAVISSEDWPQGIDPYHIDRELRSIVEEHHAHYIDILPDLHMVPNAAKLYYPIDGHMNVEGHDVISTLLAKELQQSVVFKQATMAEAQTNLSPTR